MVKRRICLVVFLVIAGQHAVFAASGEMGTGTPQFAIYSDIVGAHVKVWSISNATINFPSGCTSLALIPTTMGLDAYKAAIAVLTAAKVSGMRIRFYAHGERDGGCGGVDYIELKD